LIFTEHVLVGYHFSKLSGESRSGHGKI